MLKGRVGAGATKEIGGVNNEWIPEALFGLDYRRQLSRKQKLELTVDYFPSWEDFTDYSFDYRSFVGSTYWTKKLILA